ncbi:unnamed protein product [Urochloa humidicola]
MASTASAVKAAVVVAVFAVLLMSCRGHTKTGPLCKDCASQCYANCSAIAAANCSSYCSPPAGCDSCRTLVLQLCQDCCNSNGTSTLCCCKNDCIGECGCTSCDIAVQNSCVYACTPNYSACQACTNAVRQECDTSCNSACNDNCVKKEKEC